jgi:hypothetical protein
MEKFISILEASRLTGKSKNTIRTYCLELKEKDAKYLRFVDLKNGTQKILVDSKKITSQFGTFKTITNKKNDVAVQSNESELIEHLKSEILYLREQNDKLLSTNNLLVGKGLLLDNKETALKRSKWYQFWRKKRATNN